MNARLQYVVSQQDDVLSVPLDAVYANAQGSQAMLVLASRVRTATTPSRRSR